MIAAQPRSRYVALSVDDAVPPTSSIGTRLGDLHDVAVGSAANGPFVTIDPASGWRARTWADLDAEWSPVGHPTLVVIGLASK